MDWPDCVGSIHDGARATVNPSRRATANRGREDAVYKFGAPERRYPTLTSPQASSQWPTGGDERRRERRDTPTASSNGYCARKTMGMMQSTTVLAAADATVAVGLWYTAHTAVITGVFVAGIQLLVVVVSCDAQGVDDSHTHTRRQGG